MIKGSLLRSVPIVKRFGRKFLSPKMRQKFEVGGLGGKILSLTIRPPKKSIPTETRHLAQNGVDPCKIVISSGGQEILQEAKLSLG